MLQNEMKEILLNGIKDKFYSDNGFMYGYLLRSETYDTAKRIVIKKESIKSKDVNLHAFIKAELNGSTMFEKVIPGISLQFAIEIAERFLSVDMSQFKFELDYDLRKQ